MNLIPATDPQDEALQIYTHLNERQLRHYYEPDGGLFVCESIRVICRALEAGYRPLSYLIEAGREDAVGAELAPDADTPVYVASHAFMREVTGYALTGGVLAALHRRDPEDVSSVLRGARRIAILDDVENPTNAGAIFRSAAAMGMDAILFAGNSCDPFNRRCTRVSMGTVFQVPWAPMDADSIDIVRNAGFTVVSLALSENAVPLDDARLKQAQKIAFVPGNEDKGLSDTLLAASDFQAVIPMQNGVDSLNVAAAAAVAFWEYRS